MKRFLLSFLFLGLLAFNKLNAQPCSLANLQIFNVRDSGGKCYTNLSFDMDRNNGNKFIYVHIWNSANYAKVNKNRWKKGSGPSNADINGTSSNPYPALATVAIDNNDYNNPVFSSLNYRPDNTVPTVKGNAVKTSSTPVSGSGPKAMYRYTIYAIPLGSVGGGCSAANLAGIVWSTQANSVNSHIHCSLIGNSTPPFPLTVSGTIVCVPGKYTITVTNTTSSNVSGSIDIYADNGGTPNNGIFDPTTDKEFDSVDYFLVGPNGSFSISGPIPAAYKNYDIWTQVVLSNNSTLVQKIVSPSCGGTLPVKLQTFTATRNQQNVAVKWQTAAEQGIRGFNVLRLTDDGNWKAVAYIPSQSAGGFGAQAFSYQYNDANSFKGISQYRLQEVATDGQLSFSDIKMVRGEEQTSKLSVYPNPSEDGRVNVVFDENSIRDITVTDISGRIVKQFIAVTNNSVLIENLKTGFYNLQVSDRITHETATQKLIVKMR